MYLDNLDQDLDSRFSSAELLDSIAFINPNDRDIDLDLDLRPSVEIV